MFIGEFENGMQGRSLQWVIASIAPLKANYLGLVGCNNWNWETIIEE